MCDESRILCVQIFGSVCRPSTNLIRLLIQISKRKLGGLILRNLVDPASSHMLVSKIAMHVSVSALSLLNCEWLIKTVIATWRSIVIWITVVILELIHALTPDFSEGWYLLDTEPTHLW